MTVDFIMDIIARSIILGLMCVKGTLFSRYATPTNQIIFEQHEKRLVKIIRALCNTPRGMHPIERYFFASKEMENMCYYTFLLPRNIEEYRERKSGRKKLIRVSRLKSPYPTLIILNIITYGLNVPK